MPDELCLAHLSDPHLPVALPRGTDLLGKRGLSALNWRGRRAARHDARVAETLLADLLAARPEAIAMTGDLVNFSLDREFEAAADWLARLGPPERVIALPGNHEALSPGWRHRLARWGPHARGGDGEDYPWMRRFGRVALIAVSTAVATPPFLASGRVGPAARAALARLIAAARAEEMLPVVLMHHPPTRVTPRRKGLVDGPAVRAVLAEAGAGLVLHGHTHAPDLSWIDATRGRIPVLGVPSFSMRAGMGHAPGAWRLIALATDGGGWTATLTERAITPDGDVTARTPVRLRLA